MAGQIFEARHISATRISAPERLTVGVNKDIWHSLKRVVPTMTLVKFGQIWQLKNMSVKSVHFCC
jgi:hypothetical protein